MSRTWRIRTVAATVASLVAIFSSKTTHDHAALKAPRMSSRGACRGGEAAKRGSQVPRRVRHGQRGQHRCVDSRYRMGHDSSWFKLLQVNSSSFKLIRVNSSEFKLIQVDSSWFKLVQVNSSWFNLNKVSSSVALSVFQRRFRVFIMTQVIKWILLEVLVSKRISTSSAQWTVKHYILR